MNFLAKDFLIVMVFKISHMEIYFSFGKVPKNQILRMSSFSIVYFLDHPVHQPRNPESNTLAKLLYYLFSNCYHMSQRIERAH